LQVVTATDEPITTTNEPPTTENIFIYDKYETDDDAPVAIPEGHIYDVMFESNGPKEDGRNDGLHINAVYGYGLSIGLGSVLAFLVIMVLIRRHRGMVDAKDCEAQLEAAAEPVMERVNAEDSALLSPTRSFNSSFSSDGFESNTSNSSHNSYGSAGDRARSGSTTSSTMGADVFGNLVPPGLGTDAAAGPKKPDFKMTSWDGDAFGSGDDEDMEEPCTKGNYFDRDEQQQEIRDEPTADETTACP
jgi:hypothetical protein